MTRDETIQGIFDNIGRFRRAVHGQIMPSFEQFGMSPTQIDILTKISYHQPISHKALAKAMGLSPGAVSQLLENLISDELVVRAPSPTDRRVSYLSLSKVGKRKLDDIAKLRQKLFTAAFAALDDAELTTYLQVQQKMLSWFEAHNQETRKDS